MKVLWRNVIASPAQKVQKEEERSESSYNSMNILPFPKFKVNFTSCFTALTFKPHTPAEFWVNQSIQTFHKAGALPKRWNLNLPQLGRYTRKVVGLFKYQSKNLNRQFNHMLVLILYLFFTTHDAYNSLARV